jgi:hypothetical protein
MKSLINLALPPPSRPVSRGSIIVVVFVAISELAEIRHFTRRWICLFWIIISIAIALSLVRATVRPRLARFVALIRVPLQP